jgi:hypothetical protein
MFLPEAEAVILSTTSSEEHLKTCDFLILFYPHGHWQSNNHYCFQFHSLQIHFLNAQIPKATSLTIIFLFR